MTIFSNQRRVTCLFFLVMKENKIQLKNYFLSFFPNYYQLSFFRPRHIPSLWKMKCLSVIKKSNPGIIKVPICTCNSCPLPWGNKYAQLSCHNILIFQKSSCPHNYLSSVVYKPTYIDTPKSHSTNTEINTDSHNYNQKYINPT